MCSVARYNQAMWDTVKKWYLKKNNSQLINFWTKIACHLAEIYRYTQPVQAKIQMKKVRVETTDMTKKMQNFITKMSFYETNFLCL